MTTRTLIGKLTDANGTDCAVYRDYSVTAGEQLVLVLDAGEHGYLQFGVTNESGSDLMRMLAGEPPKVRVRRIK